MSYTLDENFDYEAELERIKQDYKASYMRRIEDLVSVKSHVAPSVHAEKVREEIKTELLALHQDPESDNHRRNQVVMLLIHDYVKSKKTYPKRHLYYFLDETLRASVDDYLAQIERHTLYVYRPDFGNWTALMWIDELAHQLAAEEVIDEIYVQFLSPKSAEVIATPERSNDGSTSERTTPSKHLHRRESIAASLDVMRATKLLNIYNEICDLDVERFRFLTVIGAFHFLEIACVRVENKSIGATLENREFLTKLGYDPDASKELAKAAKELHAWANTDKHHGVRGSFGDPSAIVTEFDVLSEAIDRVLTRSLANTKPAE